MTFLLILGIATVYAAIGTAVSGFTAPWTEKRSREDSNGWIAKSDHGMFGCFWPLFMSWFLFIKPSFRLVKKTIEWSQRSLWNSSFELGQRFMERKQLTPTKIEERP